MPKATVTYVCEACGRRYTQPYGRCPNCKTWDSLREVVEQPEPKPTARKAPPASVPNALRSEPQRLREVPSGGEARLPVPVEEFSRVLGGGLVAGSITLVSGDPGIGKSTLLLQLAAVMAQTIGRVLYASGEESARQLKMRADRLEIEAEELFLVTETHLESLLAHVERLQPHVLIVDSIQTMYSEDKPSSAGTVTQVRECAARLQMLAKTTGISVFLVGHVTKEGMIAGPRVLEHIVDTVLYLEGDAFQAYRLLRSVKNRFGATSEVGVFEMRDKGMVEVSNPSEAFLAERVINAAGSAIVVTMEGTRPLLVEVQALASPTVYPNPRRAANGVDFNRLQLLTAVLVRRVGLRLAEQDIFVNVVGGLTVEEPAADLAIATAIASSVWDKPLPADLALIGEIGLSGELRAVSQIAARLREAAKLGFKRCIVPKTLRRADPLPSGIQAIPARTLPEALAIALPREPKD
jgi:DNA repair protein RadA/Sms